MNSKRIPTVLTIGGFDSIGGAGIQADLKTIAALGCHGMNVLTALPVQNSRGVRSIHRIPSSTVKEQLLAVLEDIYPDVIKIGMIHTVSNIQVLASVLKNYTGKIILDPVLKSTSGHDLYQGKFKKTLIEKLFPLASLITPNIPEVFELSGMTATNFISMKDAAIQLLKSGAAAVLVKGGHLNSRKLLSTLITSDLQTTTYSTTKIDTKNTRGTGCTLASAIACFTAMGVPLSQAIQESINYVDNRIHASINTNLGQGNGCLAPIKSGITSKTIKGH